MLTPQKGETQVTESKGERLHIFVNRRKFEEGDGVLPQMSGAQIAALIEVPVDNAVIRWDSGPHKGEEIAGGQVVDVKNGDHFLVTRKIVEAGNASRAH